jgi:hypothetical protein
MSGGLEVRGVSGLIANVHVAKAEIGRNIRAAMQREGKNQHEDTVQEAPKRTGFLAAHTRLEFSPEGLTFTVGYDETDWADAGLYPYFYPVILGSSTQSANDFLFRVHEAHRERVTRAVGDAIRRGVESVRA